MGIYRAIVQDVLFLPVRITLPESDAAVLLQATGEIPLPVVGRLVLDTGARRSSLAPMVLARLRCPIRGHGAIQTVTGQQVVTTHDVCLEFLEGTLKPLTRWTVVRHAMPPRLAEYDGVIGRDILAGWEVVYRGPRRRLTVRDRASVWGWLASWRVIAFCLDG
jgi:hypothetical protein